MAANMIRTLRNDEDGGGYCENNLLRFAERSLVLSAPTAGFPRLHAGRLGLGHRKWGSDVCADSPVCSSPPHNQSLAHHFSLLPLSLLDIRLAAEPSEAYSLWSLGSGRELEEVYEWLLMPFRAYEIFLYPFAENSHGTERNLSPAYFKGEFVKK